MGNRRSSLANRDDGGSATSTGFPYQANAVPFTEYSADYGMFFEIKPIND